MPQIAVVRLPSRGAGEAVDGAPRAVELEHAGGALLRGEVDPVALAGDQRAEVGRDATRRSRSRPSSFQRLVRAVRERRAAADAGEERMPPAACATRLRRLEAGVRAGLAERR